MTSSQTVGDGRRDQRRTRSGVRGALVGLVALLVVAGAARANVVWLCQPGIANDPCEIPLDTTVYGPGGGSSVQTLPRAPEANARSTASMCTRPSPTS